MCGISGCLDSNNSAMEIVINALNKLQNRGYDSAGICTIDNNHFAIKKNIIIQFQKYTMLHFVELLAIGVIILYRNYKIKVLKSK